MTSELGIHESARVGAAANLVELGHATDRPIQDGRGSRKIAAASARPSPHHYEQAAVRSSDQLLDPGAAVETSELRWFADGVPPDEVVSWFTDEGRRGDVEIRRDLYVVDGRIDVGVKRRGGETLELKVRRSVGDGRASAASVPIQHGLFAAAAGAILYALFGTVRQIATGPSSALAAVAGSAVALASLKGDDAVELVAAITIVTGLLFLLLAIFKMGWISHFLSKAVITGFLSGAAIDVVVGELGKITGTSVDGANSWSKAASWLDGLGATDGATLLVGVVSLVVVVGIRFSPITVPGALVLVVVGIGASAVLDFANRGIALVGDVPRGFAAPSLPDLGFVADNLAVIGPAAIGLLLIGFSQTAADARAFASEHRYRVDIDQESVSQSAANIGSGVLQGIPVSTSLSASSLNDQSGAKTPLASLTTGVLVVLTLLVLAPLFSDLPNPVLAALIIDAVVFGMMDVTEMRRLHRVARVDFWIAVAALLAVLASGVLAGVIIGVVLSLGWLVYINATPAMPILGRKPGTQAFRSIERDPDAVTYPGLLVTRFDAGLSFASSDAFSDHLRELTHDADPPFDTIVISFEGVDFIDSQGSATLSQIIQMAAAHDADVRLARVKPSVLDLLRRDGVIDRLGEDHVFPNLYEAAADTVDAARADGAVTSAAPPQAIATTNTQRGERQ